VPKHYVLKVYAVEVHESSGREADFVTLEFDGELKQKTKVEVNVALGDNNYQLRMKKKVLA
jgi:hypothetical protein